MPLLTVPAAFGATNQGKETLSLAGLTNLPPGKLVPIDLRKFKPATNAVKVFMALEAARVSGLLKIDVAEGEQITLDLPAQVEGKIAADLVQGGVNRNRPSTGLGGAGNEAKSETATSAPAKPEAPKSVSLEAVNRPMDQIHNPTEPDLKMGAKPAALNRDAPPPPPATDPAVVVLPPPPPLAPVAPAAPAVELPPADAPASLSLSDL